MERSAPELAEVLGKAAARRKQLPACVRSRPARRPFGKHLVRIGRRRRFSGGRRASREMHNPAIAELFAGKRALPQMRADRLLGNAKLRRRFAHRERRAASVRFQSR
jgi:hypothetical protein